MRKIFLFVNVFFLLINQIKSQDTVLFATYNLLRFDAETDRNTYFKKVTDHINADVYITQELSNEGGLNNFLDNVLNNSDNKYEAAVFINVPETDIDQALFYNKNKFDFISTSKIDGDPRPIMIFRLRHKITNTEFVIFNMHLKASSGSSNEEKRRIQISQLKDYTSQMDNEFFYIAAGDFNIYSTEEPAYREFFLESNTGFGKFNDLILGGGKYNDPLYASIHTQSTRIFQFGGGANGGLDDRFDYILFSDSLIRSNKIFTIENSYTVIGNDGNHYNMALNTIPNNVVNEEIANALHDASDHLPVTTKIVFSNESIVVNNNPPVVSDTVFTISENPNNGVVIGKLNAFDPDNDLLSYKILSGNDIEIFQISPQSGHILVKEGSYINYDNYQSFLLLIEVSDGEFSDSAQVQINVIENSILSIEKLISENIKIYPNPIINNLIIESTNNKLITIRIYSLNGEEVFYNDLHSLNNKLDISSLSSGLYILKINMNNVSRKIRIIKK